MLIIKTKNSPPKIMKPAISYKTVKYQLGVQIDKNSKTLAKNLKNKKP